jgi:hypothetical protein
MSSGHALCVCRFRFWVRRQANKFVLRRRSEHGVAPIDGDWLEGEELIVVITTYYGTVDRTLMMDHLEMPAKVASRSGR